MDGPDAGGHARPDRPSRRRVRRGDGSMNKSGLPPLRCGLPSLPQGLNPVQTFIPVAITDMLLHPENISTTTGGGYLPDIKLVYWAAAIRSPPPEHFPAAARAQPRRHARRARPVLDGDGQARRHRRAIYHPVRARRLLGFPQRPAADGDAEAGRAVRAIPGRLATFTALADASASATSSPKAEPRGSGSRTCTTSGPPNWILRCPRRGVWRRGTVGVAHRERLTLLADFPGRSKGPPAEHAQRAHRDLLARHRRIRLRRLRRSPDVV